MVSVSTIGVRGRSRVEIDAVVVRIELGWRGFVRHDERDGVVFGEIVRVIE